MKSSSNALTYFLLTAISIPLLTVESKHNITAREKLTFYNKCTNNKSSLVAKHLYVCFTPSPG